MHTTPATGARKNSQLRIRATRLPSGSFRAIPMAPYTSAPNSKRNGANRSGMPTASGNPRDASSSSAATNRSRRRPDVRNSCHG